MNQVHSLHVARARLCSRLKLRNAATYTCSGNATGNCDVITAGNLAGYNWFNPVIQTFGYQAGRYGAYKPTPPGLHIYITLAGDPPVGRDFQLAPAEGIGGTSGSLSFGASGPNTRPTGGLFQLVFRPFLDFLDVLGL